MKTVLLLGGPAAGQCIETECNAVEAMDETTGIVRYEVVPLFWYGSTYWFGILKGGDPIEQVIQRVAQLEDEVKNLIHPHDLEKYRSRK